MMSTDNPAHQLVDALSIEVGLDGLNGVVAHDDDRMPDAPSIQLWQSVRADGDTKTRKSRRTLQLPTRCVEVLTRHQARQADARARAGDRWEENDLVFATGVGTELDAANVRRAFRNVVKKAGLDPQSWTPRELRHSFVSLLSEAGVPLEDLSRLVGHGSTADLGCCGVGLPGLEPGTSSLSVRLIR
jgi:Phage integrase family